MEIYKEAVDKGLESVQVCSTNLSTIDRSVLYYRGYNLEDLVKYSNFSEITHLLLKGELPNFSQLKEWEEKIKDHLFLDDQLPFSEIPTENVHPMSWLRTAVSLLGLKEEKNVLFHEDFSALEKASLSLIAKCPLLISFFHRKRQALDPIAPDKDQSLAWNFLYTLKGEPPEKEKVRILDTCLLLHADHELNCSTFSARVTSSSLSDLYSGVVSAIGALKGPLHGGANERVMKMLNQLSSKKEAERFVDHCLEKKEKIMGFGHRVYKTQDPRAVLLKEISAGITKSEDKSDIFEISEAIERRVKAKKGLCANVDFYSASVYHCLGIPTDLFTPVFAMSRMPGWLAHISEQYSKNRIYRPSSLWQGENNKHFQPIDKRP